MKNNELYLSNTILYDELKTPYEMEEYERGSRESVTIHVVNKMVHLITICHLIFFTVLQPFFSKFSIFHFVLSICCITSQYAYYIHVLLLHLSV